MAALKFTIEQIVWQEVPGEVSLAFLFSGCPLRCKGCHSADAWKEGIGTELTEDYLRGRLKRYRGLISCVLFMGGEWQPENRNASDTSPGTSCQTICSRVKFSVSIALSLKIQHIVREIFSNTICCGGLSCFTGKNASRFAVKSG